MDLKARFICELIELHDIVWQEAVALGEVIWGTSHVFNFANLNHQRHSWKEEVRGL
jgi:hypothetical protein